MTALNQYERLEARGLWRDAPDAQRREVIVSMGDATLILTDTNERPLTHWSLPAVVRLNPDELPALFSPDGLKDETLELAEDEAEMIAAIEKVRAAVEARRPHPGRLRLGLIGTTAVAVALLGWLWLPGALQKQALAVVPDVKRAELGQTLLAKAQQVTGPPCTGLESGGAGARNALDRLETRLTDPFGSPQIHVVRDGVRDAAHLPGGIILLNRSVIEDTTDPDVPAGYVIAEQARVRLSDPLNDLLDHAGLWETLRLLTTGDIRDEVLDAFARQTLIDTPTAIPDEELLNGFRDAGVRSTPYAYARDITGETTIALIEADPFAGTGAEPVLRDADWIRLQAICE